MIGRPGKHLLQLWDLVVIVIGADEIKIAFSEHFVVAAHTVTRGGDRTSAVEIADDRD